MTHDDEVLRVVTDEDKRLARVNLVRIMQDAGAKFSPALSAAAARPLIRVKLTPEYLAARSTRAWKEKADADDRAR